LTSTVDVRFRLWDAQSGGAVNPTFVEKLGIAAVNGLFTTTLDFGPGAFEGSAKWLAIEIRHPAGSGGFVPMGARQPINAAPYALHAQNVPWGAAGTDIYTTNTGNVGIGTGGPDAKLAVVGQENTSAFDGVLGLTSPGQFLPSTMTFDGDEINAWSHLHLNPNTVADVLMVEGGGDVGIGTASPAARLHVVGGTDAAPAGGGFATFGTTNNLNIAIDNNEIMARNNGAPATLFLNNDGGDIFCGGPLDIGLETVLRTTDSTGSFAMYCPTGKRALGGGCNCASGSIVESHPATGNSGWICDCSSGNEATAWAICANVK